MANGGWPGPNLRIGWMGLLAERNDNLVWDFGENDALLSLRRGEERVWNDRKSDVSLSQTK